METSILEAKNLNMEDYERCNRAELEPFVYVETFEWLDKEYLLRDCNTDNPPTCPETMRVRDYYVRVADDLNREHNCDNFVVIMRRENNHRFVNLYKRIK